MDADNLNEISAAVAQVTAACGAATRIPGGHRDLTERRAVRQVLAAYRKPVFMGRPISPYPYLHSGQSGHRYEIARAFSDQYASYPAAAKPFVNARLGLAR